MLILISGLPRSGKSSFADALAAHIPGYTHVPLDKYIKEVPGDTSFLDWVSSPHCIDWPLLQRHLEYLYRGQLCYTPLPDWSRNGRRASEGGLEGGGRLMPPAQEGYIIPGCYAFKLPPSGEPTRKVFINTPVEAVAERLVARAVAPEEAEPLLDQRLSSNWREIQGYVGEAELILAGIASRAEQLRMFQAYCYGNRI